MPAFEKDEVVPPDIGFIGGRRNEANEATAKPKETVGYEPSQFKNHRKIGETGNKIMGMTGTGAL
jgi:hypothetical protein